MFQDVRAAKLLVGHDDLERVSRTHRLLAALRGCTLLSASVLLGGTGYKVCFQAGLALKVRIFLTEEFKAEAPALTAVLRDACSQPGGWLAVTLAEARKKDGFKWGLVLRGTNEVVAAAPGRRCARLLTN